MLLKIIIGFLFVFITIVFFIYQYFERKFKYWSKRIVPHLKPSFPFGNLNIKVATQFGLIVQDIYNELKGTGAKYGGYYIFALPVFIPISIDLHKEILIKNAQYFYDHGIYCDEINDPLTANIISLPEAKSKYLRHKLSPSFSPSKLKAMFPLMKKCAVEMKELVESLDKIDINDVCSRYITDIICTCGFGIEGNSIKNPKGEFREYNRQIIHPGFCDSLRIAFGIIAPDILKTLKISFFNPKLTNIFYNIVKETVEYRKKNNIKRNDLLDSLIQLMDEDNKNGITDGITLNSVVAQVFVFFVAGSETSTMTLTFCLYELAKNPNIQERVREEILRVIEENNGEITYEAVHNMPYTDKVLRETLRRYPPVVVLNRICTETFRLPYPNSLITVEKGTPVMTSVLGVHHDPEFYPDPYTFDPERFSEEEIAKRPEMTFMPFGEGPRMCLGLKFAMMEMKLAIAVMLQNYKYSVHPDTKDKLELQTIGNLLTCKDTIWLQKTKL